MDAAVSYAISMQEFAGLDVVTDGEWRRRSYLGVIAELAHGFTLEVNPAGGRPWTVVTDKLAPKAPGFIAAEAAFLKSVARAGTKITLPAPALLGERLWDPERSRKAYPRREDFVRDCVDPLRREGGPENRPPRPAGKKSLGIFERIDRWFWRQQMRDREAYLAGAQDIFELEERLRRLERSVGSRYY